MSESTPIPDTVQSRYELLNYFESKQSKHDWGYQYSDDNRAYTSGANQASHIREVMSMLEQFGLGEVARQAYERYERQAREGRAPGELPTFFYTEPT